MNLRDLNYLVAVADNGHFGRAAEVCHVSQPALSMQIRKLEDFLGVPLFERTNKTVMITEAGRQIVARARVVLQEAENIREIADSFRDPLAGKILLGAFPTLAPYLLPKVIPALHQHFPALALYLVEEKTEVLVEKIKAGEVEAAMLAIPVEEEQLDSEELFTEEFLLALPADHRLAGHTSVSFNDIRNESLLLLEEGHCLRTQALKVCTLVGARENTEFRATSLETLRQMVAASVGMTLMPEFAVREQEGVVYLPFTGDVPSRTIALFYRKSSVRKKLLSEIAGHVRDLIGQAG
ncbi:LysR substrate-binding domain-containing protein [Emcibacter nanhaiensis]|uniref:LysR family transcriptional regulator n=1 Tax=Emcibacter nanhaiensis TaxID=1505037 RepID=A0A501PR37_9PROT|nr:LysR substrate-binding domain-containing protein [Emcibacter nanhaiensis]TPD62587.1 LysR family transcriptional regulator [Emcibacter nanhaiensis]